MARLRLHVVFDYDADPSIYRTDDPYEMAMIDYVNLIQGEMTLEVFLHRMADEGRLSYAIEPLA